MSERDVLAAYQRRLLESLGNAAEPSEVLAELLRDDALRPFHETVRGFEPRAVDVGMALVERWGERRVETRPGHEWVHVLERPGSPLALRERAIGVPSAGQVRLRVLACGVCGTDVHAWQGHFPVPTPCVLGHEIVGRVEAVGDAVPPSLLGELVGVPWMQAACGACDACGAGQGRFCRRGVSWLQLGGGFGPSVIVDARGCIPIPPGLEPTLAAPLFCAGHTVAGAFERAELKPSDRVAVVGLGGLGHLAVQVARLRGHAPVVVTRHGKRGDALSLGAADVVDLDDQPAEALRTSGGVDVLFAFTSDLRRLGEFVGALRPGGRIVLAALDATSTPVTIAPLALIAREASIVGAKAGSREALVELLDWTAAGRLRPWVEPVRRAQLHRALHRVREGRVRYRAVLIPATSE